MRCSELVKILERENWTWKLVHCTLSFSTALFNKPTEESPNAKRTKRNSQPVLSFAIPQFKEANWGQYSSWSRLDGGDKVKKPTRYDNLSDLNPTSPDPNHLAKIVREVLYDAGEDMSESLNMS